MYARKISGGRTGWRNPVGFLCVEMVFLYYKMTQVNLAMSSARYAFGYPGQNAALAREKSLKPFGYNIGTPLFGALL